MDAMVMTEWGPWSALEHVKGPDPEAGPNDVVVDVHASGCNFFDALICAGKYQVRPPLPFSPGAEVAGVVRAVGSDVTGISVGQRVMALLPWGGYASVIKAPADRVFALPESLTMEQAAGFGIVYQTSYFALVYRAALQAGETLLVHAAAGGVGLAAVQIGRALGARVIGTAGSDEKCALVTSHGAERCFNYRNEDWRAGVKALTDDRGADVVFDPVGGDVFDTSTRCIAFAGRLLVIGFASGRIPSIQMNRVLLKNISVVGLHWGAYLTHDPAKIGVAMCKLYGMVDAGDLKPLISNVYPLREAATALDDLVGRKTVGKVVLTP